MNCTFEPGHIKLFALWRGPSPLPENSIPARKFPGPLVWPDPGNIRFRSRRPGPASIPAGGQIAASVRIQTDPKKNIADVQAGGRRFVACKSRIKECEAARNALRHRYPVLFVNSAPGFRCEFATQFLPQHSQLPAVQLSDRPTFPLRPERARRSSRCGVRSNRFVIHEALKISKTGFQRINRSKSSPLGRSRLRNRLYSLGPKCVAPPLKSTR